MSTVLYEDVVGQSHRLASTRLSAAGLKPELAAALVHVLGSDVTLTPPQVEALRAGLLSKKGHWLVSAPTNSGKTLIAIMRVFERLLDGGGRSIFVVPLKALAEEKASEIRTLAALLRQNAGRDVITAVSTGDYRLTEEMPDSPPPDGELLVCTPERLEVILRNPAHRRWAGTIDTFVLDEFHLLGEGERGARFETLVTRMLCDCRDASILALSATMGGLDDIEAWFGNTGSSVTIIESDFRFPQLRRRIVRTENKDEYILRLASALRPDDHGSLIVFVYRKNDAERLAKRIRSEVFQEDGVAFFHAGLGQDTRLALARRFREGAIRVLVSTTSLKLGINTPATHVVVRDTTFYGAGRLPTRDVLQMLGRAGRGDATGDGTILCSEGEDVTSYAQNFRTGRVESLQPQLIPRQIRSRTIQRSVPQPIRSALLSELGLCGETSVDRLSAFLAGTYSGVVHQVGRQHIEEHLAYLEQTKLAYRVENSEATYAPTKLGKICSVAGLSAETGGMFGSFLRGLIRLTEKLPVGAGSDLLGHLTSIDFLFLAMSSWETRDKVLQLGRQQIRWSRVEEVLELLPPEEKPSVNMWRYTVSEDYPTRRLLGTLQFEEARQEEPAQERLFRRLLTSAIMLFEYSRGGALESIEDRYGVTVGQLEGDLRPTVTWILNGLAQICTGRKCYRLDHLAVLIFELIEDLTVGAHLGKLVGAEGFGRRSAEKLIVAGVRDLADPRLTSRAQLEHLGLGRRQVEVVLRTVRRRDR